MKNASNSLFLLDTSAILAFTDAEAGAERVKEILGKEAVILPFMVVLEVYYITLQDHGQKMADTRFAMLKALQVSHMNEVSEQVLLTAGRFKAQHPLSLADAMIAALAVRNNAILVHKDPEYDKLGDQVLHERLPYKKRK